MVDKLHRSHAQQEPNVVTVVNNMLIEIVGPQTSRSSERGVATLQSGWGGPKQISYSAGVLHVARLTPKACWMQNKLPISRKKKHAIGTMDHLHLAIYLGIHKATNPLVRNEYLESVQPCVAPQARATSSSCSSSWFWPLPFFFFTWDHRCRKYGQ